MEFGGDIERGRLRFSSHENRDVTEVRCVNSSEQGTTVSVRVRNDHYYRNLTFRLEPSGKVTRIDTKGPVHGRVFDSARDAAKEAFVRAGYRVR